MYQDNNILCCRPKDHRGSCKEINMQMVYPSAEEILPDIMLARVPASLASEIRERYELLGPKYVTDKVHTDGRLINGCMFKSSIQDALEEIVDCCFNVLVWIMKLDKAGTIQYTGANAYQVLMGIIEIYSILVIERERDALANSRVSA